MKKTNIKMFLLPMLLMAFIVMVNTTNVQAAIFTNPTAVGFGEAGMKYANVPAQTDAYFKFTTTQERAYYSLTGSVINGGSRYFYVYSGPDTSYSHERLWVGDEDNNTMVLNTLPNHTYYILVEGNYYNPSHIKVQINKILDDCGNDFGSATQLSLGQSRDGVSEVNNEVDFYKFTTSSRDSFYEVSLGGTGSSYTRAAIYDGGDASYHHTEMTAYSGETASRVDRLEKNHTYYIKVWGSSRYKISAKEIIDDAADDFKGCPKITNKKTKFGKLQVANDVDYYKFKTDKKKGAYQFTAKNTSTSYIYVTIYSRNDIASAITQVNRYYLGNADSTTLWLSLKKNHTYYAKVEGGANATYKLNFTDSQSAIKTNAPKEFRASASSYYWSPRVYLNWKNVSKFGGYEIWRSTHRSYGYKKIKSIKGNTYSSYSYTDEKVKRRKTYYYKIRYYVRDNGKTYGGKWSAVRSARPA